MTDQRKTRGRYRTAVTEQQEDKRQSRPLQFDYCVAVGAIQSAATLHSTLGTFLYSRFRTMWGENLRPEGGVKQLEWRFRYCTLKLSSIQ
jgi:hypothetical protein